MLSIDHLVITATDLDAGLPAELFAAEGQGHGLDWATEPRLWARLSAFLNRHLGAP